MATANFIQGSEWQLTYRKLEWMLDTDKHTQRFMGQFLRIKRSVHQHPRCIISLHITFATFCNGISSLIVLNIFAAIIFYKIVLLYVSFFFESLLKIDALIRSENIESKNELEYY